MKLWFFAPLVLLACLQAAATTKPHPPRENLLLTREQLMSLTFAEQKTYIKTVREIFVEMNQRNPHLAQEFAQRSGLFAMVWDIGFREALADDKATTGAVRSAEDQKKEAAAQAAAKAAAEKAAAEKASDEFLKRAIKKYAADAVAYSEALTQAAGGPFTRDEQIEIDFRWQQTLGNAGAAYRTIGLINDPELKKSLMQSEGEPAVNALKEATKNMQAVLPNEFFRKMADKKVKEVTDPNEKGADAGAYTVNIIPFEPDKYPVDIRLKPGAVLKHTAKAAAPAAPASGASGGNGVDRGGTANKAAADKPASSSAASGTTAGGAITVAPIRTTTLPETAKKGSRGTGAPVGLSPKDKAAAKPAPAVSKLEAMDHPGATVQTGTVEKQAAATHTPSDYRCMYAGFVIKEGDCHSPKEMPSLKSVDPAIFKCESGFMCNPFVFGVKLPKSCNWEAAKNKKEDVAKCLLTSTPYCTPRSTTATSNCAAKSKSESSSETEVAVETAVQLILSSDSNQSAYDEFQLSFDELCDGKHINFGNSKSAASRKRITDDITSTCDIARESLNKVKAKYAIPAAKDPNVPIPAPGNNPKGDGKYHGTR
jgi:hypothetical protein